MRVFILIFFICKILVFADEYVIELVIGSFKTKTEANKVYKSLKCISDNMQIKQFKSSKIIKNTKHKCESIKYYGPRRSCEIKEALDYLRNSGYYHFEKSAI